MSANLPAIIPYQSSDYFNIYLISGLLLQVNEAVVIVAESFQSFWAAGRMQLWDAMRIFKGNVP